MHTKQYIFDDRNKVTKCTYQSDCIQEDVVWAQLDAEQFSFEVVIQFGD